METRVRDALGGLETGGQRVTDVQVTRVEGQSVHGLVRITGAGVYSRLLLDFQATLAPTGEVSFLEVNGRRVHLGGTRQRRSRA